jgi:hypothetical protein
MVRLWIRSFPDVLGCALSEHVVEWTAEHPAQRRSAGHQAIFTLLLALGVVAVFLTDMNTPPETPMAVMYACALFAAGALLPPLLASVIGAATLGVYVVDGWIAPSGWTAYRWLGLIALLVAGLWALRTGADHARLRARAGTSAPAAVAPDKREEAPSTSAQDETGQRGADDTLKVLRSLLERSPKLDSAALAAALGEEIAALETPT